jgi:uncharacterized membrane protein
MYMSFTAIERGKNYICVHKFPVSLLVSILTYTILLSYISILKHQLFLTTAWDLGIYEQSIWSTANSAKLFWYTVELPINPNGCFFGIHFSPLLFLVLPVYKVFQSTATLLVLQSLAMALGAVPLYLIGLQETNNRKYALFFSILYLVYPPLLGVNLFDFHTQSFLPLFFFFAFYYFRNKSFLRYFFFVILALSAVEFVPFIVMFFGLYGLWIGWKEFKQSGETVDHKFLFSNRTVVCSVLTVFAGGLWYVMARRAIFYFNPTVLPNTNWMQLGDPVNNPSGLLWNMVSNPLRTAQLILSSAEQKIAYIFGILAPVGFLSLLDLPVLLIGAPWFLAAFLSNYPPYYTAVGYQYVAFVIPFIFISAVRGVKKFSVIRSTIRTSKFKLIRLFSSVDKINKKLLLFFYLFILVVSYGLTSQPYINSLIGRLSSRSQQHLIALNKILELIPSNASIMTQNDIFPHISERMYAYAMWEWNASIAGNMSATDFFLRNASVDYILIDTTSDWYRDNIEEFTSKLIENGSFRILNSADYIWLLKKGNTTTSPYLFENGLSIGLYNQGLNLSVYNSSLPKGVPLLSEIVLNVSVSDELLKQLSPYRYDSGLIAAWEGLLFVPADGEYSFYVLSNSSNARTLRIDNNVILNSEDSTSKCALRTGFHSIVFEYEITENDEPLFLFWKPPWEELPKILSSDFLYLTSVPAVSSIVFTTSFNFGYKSPFPTINRDYFSAFISGSLNIENSGLYAFKVDAENYTLIYVDDSLVYNSYAPNLSNASDAKNVFKLELDGGRHKILIFYVALEGDASLNLMWEPPGKQAFEEIPYSVLFWGSSMTASG